MANGKEGFLALLLHCDLLTKHNDIGDNYYPLIIPNNEACECIGNLRELFLKNKSIESMNKLISSIPQGLPEKFCKDFHKCLQQASFRDVCGK